VRLRNKPVDVIGATFGVAADVRLYARNVDDFGGHLGLYICSASSALRRNVRAHWPEVTVVGGLAVVCRMGTPHCATTNLEIVNRRGVTEQKLKLLVAGPAGQATRGMHSSQLPFGMFRSI
jgi:hypothetical protein